MYCGIFALNMEIMLQSYFIFVQYSDKLLFIIITILVALIQQQILNDSRMLVFGTFELRKKVTF